MKKRDLTKEELETLEIFKRKIMTLIDIKECALASLHPITKEIEELRLRIDDLEEGCLDNNFLKK